MGLAIKIKCFFGCHDPIINKRTFVGYSYKFDRYAGREKFYDFILEAECFYCGAKLKARQKIMWLFATKEKYDINPDEWE